MSDKNLTTFLTEWGGQVKELIEPNKEKLTPEFYLGSKAKPEDSWLVYTLSYLGSIICEYIGDGELSVIPSDLFYFTVENDMLFLRAKQQNISGTLTVTSAKTNNYKAGEWAFRYELYEE